MKSVFRISEAGAIAMHAAAYLALRGGPIQAPEIATALDVSEAHLMKVMQQLSRAGICSSIRGPRGGFRLSSDPSRVTLLEVFEAIEGPMSETRCLFNSRKCAGRQCLVGDMVKKIATIAHTTLSKTSLSSAAKKLEINKKGGRHNVLLSV